MERFCGTIYEKPGLRFLLELCLGAFSAIVAQTLTAPLERLKLYLQVESKELRGGVGYREYKINKTSKDRFIYFHMIRFFIFFLIFLPAGT